MPKGPSRTKNTTESEFRYGEKIRCGNSKTLRTGLRDACFSMQKRQENGTESEKLRQQQNATDSSDVLFLVRKGPLGGVCPSMGVIGKSAPEIGQFLRRNFWMISGGPFLSRPLCFIAEDSWEKPSMDQCQFRRKLLTNQYEFPENNGSQTSLKFWSTLVSVHIVLFSGYTSTGTDQNLS